MTRTGIAIVGRDCLGIDDDTFKKPSLKCTTGIYLKSMEELQMNGKSPFLEIGTKKADCCGRQRPRRGSACSQVEKGPLIRRASEVPYGFKMLGY